MPKLYRCTSCLNIFGIELGEVPYTIDGRIICTGCWELSLEMAKKLENAYGTKDAGCTPMFKKTKFKEPDHYHQQEMDTIEFLQKGFAPQVFIGFAVGSAVKYLHRYEEKNGYEDLDKAIDYIDRLKAFLKEKDLL